MKKFGHTALWNLLRNPEKSTFDPVQADAALDEFVIELHDYCHEDRDLAERTRTLNIAASDLSAIRKCLTYESGEKRAYPDYGHRPSRRRHRMRNENRGDGIGPSGAVRATCSHPASSALAR